MPKKKPKPKQIAPKTSLEDAIAVRDRARCQVETGDPAHLAKHIDAYTRAANLVRQFEKDNRRALASFTDDEIIEYLRTLPERRREAILIAVQGSSLAGKPLF